MAKTHKWRRQIRRDRFVFRKSRDPVMNRNLRSLKRQLDDSDVQEQLESVREPVTTY